MKNYIIAPLKWEHAKTEDNESWSAGTVFCTLTVARNCYEIEGQWTSWKFEYCRHEYYDEHSEEVDSSEDGKAKAKAWYLKTLMPALKEAKP